MVKSEKIMFESKGWCHIVNLTDEIKAKVAGSGINSGIVTIFTPSATSALTTIEFEPGLVQDIPEFLEKILPSNVDYKHDLTWHDGNGFSHMRAALLGPDITVPFTDGDLSLGTWQNIVFLDFDNRDRNRHVILQIIGE